MLAVTSSSATSSSGLIPLSLSLLTRCWRLWSWCWSRCCRRWLLLLVLSSPGSSFLLREDNTRRQHEVIGSRGGSTSSGHRRPAQRRHDTVYVESLQDPVTFLRRKVRPQGGDLKDEPCLMLVSTCSDSKFGNYEIVS